MESSVVNAVGAWFYSIDTDRLLYLMRRGPRHAMTWNLPGGKCAANEPLLTALHRECQEEMSVMPDCLGVYPLEQFTSSDRSFRYHTFCCLVTQEFMPTLNHEHIGYAWVTKGTWPRPMHPGLWTTVNLDEIMGKMHCAINRQMSQ